MSNLKSIRSKLKITQRQLAHEIGHTASSVGHYESGRRIPDITTCHLIVNALNSRGVIFKIEDVFPHPVGPDHAAQ